jgi:hypothetical protein
MLTICASLLLTPFAYAQESGRAAGQAEPAGVVEGFVTNTDGRPIKGAEVGFSNYVASQDKTIIIPYSTKRTLGLLP